MSQTAQDPAARNTVVRIDRRAYARYPRVCRPAILHCGALSEPCTIRNISAGGLMVRIYKCIALEGAVSVELETGIRLLGSIAWANGWDFGIAFATPIDVDAALGECTASGVKERRAAPRTPINCPARLRLPSRLLRARAKEISPYGARLETLRPVASDTRVTLTLPDLPSMAGTVRWSTGNSAGVSFAEPLPPDVLAVWIKNRQG